MNQAKADMPDDSFFGVLKAGFLKFYGTLLVIATFAISVGLVSCTKYIYVTYGFKFPIWLTSTHMAMSYLLAATGIHVLNLVPERRVLSFREQVRVVVPFSILGASSIACGNAALVFLYPSFHEMLQNLTPLWTVMCSIAFKGIRYNTAAYLALVPVTCGGMLCALGEPTKVALLGLSASLGAGALRALRAIVQGNILRGQQPIDSLTLLYYATPFNLVMFLVGSMLLEGLAPWREVTAIPLAGQLFIAGVAFLAALYNLFAFLMVGHLGPVMAMVVSNLKTPSIIVLSTVIFGNQCTLLQGFGFAVAFSGTYAFNKYGKEVSPTEGSHDVEKGAVMGKQQYDLVPISEEQQEEADCLDEHENMVVDRER